LSIVFEWEDFDGVVIDVFLFGGRWVIMVFLVIEVFDWEYGVFFGVMMLVEMIVVFMGEVGKFCFDLMVMLLFCGYNMVDYFGYWLWMVREYGM